MDNQQQAVERLDACWGDRPGEDLLIIGEFLSDAGYGGITDALSSFLVDKGFSRVADAWRDARQRTGQWQPTLAQAYQAVPSDN